MSYVFGIEAHFGNDVVVGWDNFGHHITCLDHFASAAEWQVVDDAGGGRPHDQSAHQIILFGNGLLQLRKLCGNRCKLLNVFLLHFHFGFQVQRPGFFNRSLGRIAPAHDRYVARHIFFVLCQNLLQLSLRRKLLGVQVFQRFNPLAGQFNPALGAFDFLNKGAVFRHPLINPGLECPLLLLAQR